MLNRKEERFDEVKSCGERRTTLLLEKRDTAKTEESDK